MNYKRHRPRKQAKCKLCTPRKYVGNQASRKAHGRGRWLNGKRFSERLEIEEQS